MTDKKKKYLAPEMTVVEIKGADIICTSTNDPFTPDTYDPWTPQP